MALNVLATALKRFSIAVLFLALSGLPALAQTNDLLSSLLIAQAQAQMAEAQRLEKTLAVLEERASLVIADARAQQGIADARARLEQAETYAKELTVIEERFAQAPTPPAPIGPAYVPPPYAEPYTPRKNLGILSADETKDFLLSILAERDRQYNQRFDAQEKANNQRFEAQEKAISSALTAAKEAVGAALTAAKEAVTKAEGAAEKRFDSVNEFRGTLRDQNTTFMSRVEVNAQTKGLEERLGIIQNRLDRMTGAQEGAGSFWLAILGGGGLLIALLTFGFTVFRSRPASA